MNRLQRIIGAIAVAHALSLAASTVGASPYSQTNLVSNVPNLAQVTDADLINPWGLSFGATRPFWTSNQGSNTSTLYRDVNGVATKVGLTVAIPTTPTGPQGPTGQVNNTTGSFALSNGGSSAFIFANLNGTLSAWNGALGTTAEVVRTVPGAVYTGLAITNGVGGPRLYAANTAQNRIDVFDGSFAPVALGGSAFTDNDPALAGLVPFNVTAIGGKVYVTYAPAGRAAQIAAPEGAGAVAIYDTDGTLLDTLITGSLLASPWGLALAPATFGAFGGALLVGNFSFAVAEINAFDPITGAYLGTVADQDGDALINSGLWSLAFGNGVSGSADTLYFTAGINGERDGLFGAIRAVPEPAPVMMMGVGVMLMLAMRRRMRCTTATA